MAWVLILLVTCVRAFLAPHSHTVYRIFAEAGRHWLAGHGLYPPAFEDYRYSPLVAASLVPFGLLPDAVGGVFWRLLNGGAYLAGLAWWCRAVLPPGLGRTRKAILFLLVAPLSAGNLNNGQSNALVLGLLLASVAAIAGHRWNWASAFLALATLFKLYPLAIALLLAAVYPRRLAGRLAIALLVGVLVPYLLQSPGYVTEQYAGWLNYLRCDDRQIFAREWWYRDLRLLCANVGIAVSPTAYLFIQLVTAAGIAGLCVGARWQGWPESQLLTVLFGLGCCWMTLLGSATESSTYILLAPAASWAALESWRRPTPLRWLPVASFGLLLSAPIAGMFPIGRSYQAFGPQPMAALVFLSWLLLMCARAFRQSILVAPSATRCVPRAAA